MFLLALHDHWKWGSGTRPYAHWLLVSRVTWRFCM